ncbi:MAG: glycosyltransferase [Syntrophobacteraceae bacterium]|jgi:hypothetical protein|nr:glycosyltransferase [Syntrophobacteraceae bacterium]
MMRYPVDTNVLSEAVGPSYSVPRLCQSLSDLGEEVQLHCLQDASPRWNFPIHPHRQWAFPAQLGVSPAMYRGLRLAAHKANIMHTQGLWMMPNIYPAWVARKKDCRLVTSPRGTLDLWAWARSRWKKMLGWPLQKEALLSAACLNATAESEYRHIRRMNLSAPIAIIPNGIDIPESPLPTENHDHKQLLF